MQHGLFWPTAFGNFMHPRNIHRTTGYFCHILHTRLFSIIVLNKGVTFYY